VVTPLKEIQENREQLFEMMQFSVQEKVGKYLSKLMDVELAHFLAKRRINEREAI
jgi:putative transposase